MRRVPFLAALLVSLSAPAHGADTWTNPFSGVSYLRQITAVDDIHLLKIDLCAALAGLRHVPVGKLQVAAP